jgi:hypothetical protein
MIGRVIINSFSAKEKGKRQKTNQEKKKEKKKRMQIDY